MRNRIWLPVVSAPADDPASNPGSGAGSPGAAGDSPSLAGVFGPLVGVDPPAAPADDAKPGAAGDPGEGSKPGDDPAKPAAADWTIDRFFAERYPEGGEFLKGEKAVTEWKTTRELVKQSLSAAKEASAREMALKAELEALRAAGGGQALPETEAVKKLQLELADFQKRHETELAEWRQHQAKQQLAENPAFAAEFDGKRAVIAESAQEIAKAAGVADEVLQAALNAKNEYDLAKALEGVEDEKASRLLLEKGREFLAISKAREAALKGNVLDELKRWQDYEQRMSGVVSARFTEALKGQFNAAVPAVAERLKADPFFATEAGRAVMGRISSRFAAGVDMRPEEIVEALARAESADVYKLAADNLGKQLQAVQKELARYKAADPAAVAGDGQPGAGEAPQGLLGGLFAGMMPRRG